MSGGGQAAPHIVFLVDGFPRVLGGGERVVLRNARLLVEAGFRVSLITLRVDEASDALDDPPCPVYLLPITGVFRPHALRAAWRLGSFLRREHVAVVETFFESSNLFGGVATRLLSGARLVWNRRDMGILRERKHHTLYRWLGRLPGGGLPHHVIAVSEQVRRHAIDVDGVPPEHTTVIYNGVDPARWRHTHPAAAGAQVLRVVCLGNLRAIKGQDVLLEAAGLLATEFPAMRVQFAGAALEPAYLQALEARQQQLGLATCVEFAGAVTDLPGLLNGAAVGVLPSRSEGFSNALIEMMAAGLPVVATDVGGNREAIDDGVTGTVVPPDDPAALADALRPLLRDPARRLAMGTAGRQRVAARFAEAAVVQQMVELYRRLAGARG